MTQLHLRSRRTLALVGVTLLGLIGATSTSLAGGAGAPSRATSSQTLTFDVVTSPFHLVDVGDKGVSVGDQTVFDDLLFKNGKRVGFDSGACTVTRVAMNERDPFRVSCVATYALPGGTIAAQGVMTNNPTKVLAIVGGTGAYEGAHGQITFVEFGNGKGSVTINVHR
ncbi:allene oxide cyclase barrel-like domain-containing protein [Deinococcus pimensis]|uniref:allene oxide cyclase barrel-like domain-containing protein n=1 Tax=Deinococcus pimensis TaxID=309888 RepID=UPI000486CA81|nr:hypothetical protein [Deinococcus pimensis]